MRSTAGEQLCIPGCEPSQASAPTPPRTFRPRLGARAAMMAIAAMRGAARIATARTWATLDEGLPVFVTLPWPSRDARRAALVEGWTIFRLSHDFDGSVCAVTLEWCARRRTAADWARWRELLRGEAA